MKSRPRTKALKKSNMGTESRNTYTMWLSYEILVEEERGHKMNFMEDRSSSIFLAEFPSK
jgi:hypothetical protein